jgi:histidyl-tRNA synthetase
MDYYNLTVFEWVTERLGAQGTICGGGRYDGLFELLGGKPTPACGFSIGVERVLELMGAPQGTDAACDVYVVHQGGATFDAALEAAERLRDAGVDVILHAGDASLKSQMKKADASGAEIALIIGAEELAERAVTVKALRAAHASAPFARQERLAASAMVERVVDALCADDGAAAGDDAVA